jgi:hypothetical protein
MKTTCMEWFRNFRENLVALCSFANVFAVIPKKMYNLHNLGISHGTDQRSEGKTLD